MSKTRPTVSAVLAQGRKWYYCRNNTFLRAVFLLAVNVFLGRTASAQGLTHDPQAVFVTFHSTESTYALPPSIEQTIARDLAKICAAQFPYWTYRVRRSNDSPAIRVTLKLDPARRKWLLSVALFPAGQSAEVASWPEPLFAPGDSQLSGGVLPPESQAADLIIPVFERIVNLHKSEIVPKLKETIPLGTVAVILAATTANSTSPPRAVFPVSWDHHCREYADSEFDIEFETKNRDSVTLHAKGIKRPLGFTSARPIFWAIAVQLDTYQAAGSSSPDPISQHVDDLLQLRSIAIRLAQERYFARSCENPADPLSVVQ